MDGAARRLADGAGERRAARAGPGHVGARRIDQRIGDAGDGRVVFQREARPVRRVGAAGPAGAADGGRIGLPGIVQRRRYLRALRAA